MKRGVLKFLAFAVMGILAGSHLHASPDQGRPIRAFVSIVPQAYLVQRIGGDCVDVRVLVGEGQDPHTYEPSPAQMSLLARSDIYFAIGVPFETVLLPKLQSLFPNLKITDTAKGVSLRYFSPRIHHGEVPESHGTHGHDDQMPDPHTWLDPKRVRIMAGNIALSLKAIDPAHAGVFERNLLAFRQDLDALDSEIARILEPLKGNKIYVFHPAFGYFCESYGLEQKAFEIRGKEPGARQLARLIESAKAEGVTVIFVQPQFSVKAARAIADSIGGIVVPINPLPRNYLLEMKSLAERVRDARAGQGSAPGNDREATGNAR